MIQFEEFTLKNGLEVIIQPEPKVSTVCVNILYKVGSRNENPEKTGFAHLFEHLMFGGSKHIKNFDEELQAVGGENNAFTSTDITNYYITVPSTNLETALWLESDRMLSLSFDPQVLEVQRKVVIEEFKQRYLNQPYGDLWLKLRPEAYRVHPYKWATIGKEISHIEEATMEDVKTFFKRYYHPGNAVLVLAGDITPERGLALAEKWFGPIPSQETPQDEIPQEPRQQEKRYLEISATVPQNMLTKVFHMPGRSDFEEYAKADLVSDLLGRGKSSRFYDRLVKKTPLFSSLNSYVMGSMDPGLLVVSGKLRNGSFEKAESAIGKEIDQFLNQGLDQGELDKVKNMALSSIVFGEVEVLNRAMSLAFAKYLGNINLVNEEIEIIESLTAEHIMESAAEVLREENSTTLHYVKNEDQPINQQKRRIGNETKH
jgi:zinc protease